MEMGGGER
ncbi:hypothetical protein E2C01_026708 [Portunus trituberculatus]|uniref:Uncharacterized protein n=1 Tax=Portunus trituberculatus TaxID=210409 RepID=A0A5B7EG11_PORTR|nr:hypothetical protein [Portunus trituberculatus]